MCLWYSGLEQWNQSMCSKYTVLKVTHIKNDKQSTVSLLYKQNTVKRKQRMWSKSFAFYGLLIMHNMKYVVHSTDLMEMEYYDVTGKLWFFAEAQTMVLLVFGKISSIMSKVSHFCTIILFLSHQCPGLNPSSKIKTLTKSRKSCNSNTVDKSVL